MYALCAYRVRKLRLNCRFKRSGDCAYGPAKLRRVEEMERLCGGGANFSSGAVRRPIISGDGAGSFVLFALSERAE